MNMTPDEFRALAREVIDDSQRDDPAALAAEVLDRLDRDDALVALSVTLPGWIRVHLGSAARSARTTTEGQPKATATRQRQYRRVKAVRDDWRTRALSARYHGLIWKRLGAFTVDDCQAAAAKRRADSDANKIAADRFEALAVRIAESGGTTVDDVATDTLQWLLSDGAL
jgi:hypothetical protein